jgi:hypothetical protein
MHRKFFLAWLIKPLESVFEKHALFHHGYYYRIFIDEPVPKGTDRGFRLKPLEGFLESLPIAAILAIFSWQGAVIFPIVVIMHHLIWNAIHLEMHKPEKRFFHNWPIYKYLGQHHYLHHKYPGTNFNVVLPMADWVLGTNRNVTRADWKGLYKAGLLNRMRGLGKISDLDTGDPLPVSEKVLAHSGRR